MSEKVISINKKSEEAVQRFLELSKEYISKKVEYMRISMDLFTKKGELDQKFQKDNVEDFTKMELLGKELDTMQQKITDCEMEAAGIEKPKKKEEEKKDGQK